MAIQELRQLSRTIATSDANDKVQQHQILSELQNLWGVQLDQGSSPEIDSYFEFAVELVRYLVEGRNPGPDELLTLVTKLLARAERTLARPTRGLVGQQAPMLKMPEASKVAELQVATIEAVANETVTLNDLMLGELLVHLGILSSSQVTAAMETRESHGRFGEACVQLGFATPDQIQEGVQLQKQLRNHPLKDSTTSAPEARGVKVVKWRQSFLGEILVSSKAIGREQLTEALQAQRATGLLLGEVLVQMGACNWGAVRGAIRIQESMRSQDQNPWK